MEREKMESLLIDYIDGKLNSADKHYVEQELVRNPQAYRLYEELKTVITGLNRVSPVVPSEEMRAGFREALAGELRAQKKEKVVRLRPFYYRIAAAIAILIAGLIGGLRYSDWKFEQRETARLEAERARSRALMARMSDEGSPAQRILAVKSARQDGSVNDDILDALIERMNADPNANVRIAAIEALFTFRDLPGVREALVKSLPEQTDPVVQIALIQLLVQLKAKDAVGPLKEIIEDSETLDVVKDEAHKGIFVLS